MEMTARQKDRDLFLLPVTKSQVLAVAGLDKHHLGAEEQLLHDVCEQPCIHLWVGEALGQPAAVLNQLVATGNAVPVQVQDGDAQGGTGGLARVEEERSTQGVQGPTPSSQVVRLWELFFLLHKAWKTLKEGPTSHSKLEVEINKFHVL